MSDSVRLDENGTNPGVFKDLLLGNVVSARLFALLARLVPEGTNMRPHKIMRLQ